MQRVQRGCRPLRIPRVGHRWLPVVLTLVLTLLAGVLLVRPAHAQEPETTTPTTSAPDLATYEGWLREAFAAAQRRDRLGLEEVAEQLVTTTAIRAPDESLVPVDNTWLRESLDMPEPDLRQIEQRLGALIDALALPDTTAPDDARQQLESILSRPPFEQPESITRSESYVSKFLDWLIRLIDGVLEPVANVGPGPANILGWVITTLALLLIVGVLIYLLLSLRRASGREAHLDDDTLLEERITSAQAMQHASEQVQHGDRRTAVRYLYLASLLWLDERELLRYDRALTNREYLRQLTNPELRTHLAPVIETFDRVWYGYSTLNADEFDTYEQRVKALRSLKIRKETVSDQEQHASSTS